VTAGLAVSLGACSSGGTTSSSGGGQSGDAATAACVKAADAYAAPYETLPTRLPASFTPIRPVPAPGTIIKLVNGTIPSDETATEQFQRAAATLKWKLSQIVFDGTVEDLNNKFEQAISQRPTVIVLSGWPVASIQRPLADAKKAGIAVILSSIPDNPTSYPGFAAVVNGRQSYEALGKLQAYLFMAASRCTGNVAIFSLAGYQILKVATDSFIATLKAECPQCRYSYDGIESSQIGTPAATNAIVSKLQSSPSTKYIYAVIANIAAGLTPALTQAGLSGISIFGQVPDITAIKALQDGTNAWWIDQGAIEGYLEMDAVLEVASARHVVTQSINDPNPVLTTKNVPSGETIPIFPADYATEFQHLWTS
jgi:ABC-type sugar transport system substrate-binding protein